MGPDSI